MNQPNKKPRLIYVFLFLTFYILFFSNMPGGADTIAQVGGVLMLMVCAGMSLATCPIRKIPISGLEAIFYIMALVSLLVTVAPSDPTLPYLSMLLVVFLAACSVIIRVMSFREIEAVLAISYLAILLTILIVDAEGYLRGLSADVVYGVGLFRFMPLGFQPNLSGFLFGAGSIILFLQIRRHTPAIRIIYAVGTALSASMIFASSARASFVAVVLAVAISFLLRFRSLSARSLKILFGSAIVASLGAAIWFDKALEYFMRVFDLDSNTRGFDSGGSGRVDLWLRSIDVIQNRDGIELFFGTGFRSSAITIIGYSTESSYFTLILEHGVVLSAIVLANIYYRAFYLSKQLSKDDTSFNTAGLVLLFAIIQSFFNRYLVALGNPLSVFLIFVYLAPLRLIRPSVTPSLKREPRFLPEYEAISGRKYHPANRDKPS